MEKAVKEMTLSNKEYAALNAQAANYRVILRLVLASGINNFLRGKNLAPIDLDQTPDDPQGGESVVIFLKSIADECNRMDVKIQDLSTALVETNIDLAKYKQAERKNRKSLFKRVKDYIFIPEEDLE